MFEVPRRKRLVIDRKPFYLQGQYYLDLDPHTKFEGPRPKYYLFIDQKPVLIYKVNMTSTFDPLTKNQ
jgi:hypothetical protein